MDNHRTVIKRVEVNKVKKEPFTNSCSTTHKDRQKITDLVANKLNEAVDQPINKIEIDQTNNYFFKTIFKLRKKNEESEKQQKTIGGNAYKVTEAKVEVESDDDNRGTVNDIHEENENVEAQNAHRETIDGNTSNCNGTRNEANEHVKEMETDTNNSQRLSFQCALCQKWYNTKQKIALHITKSHKSSTVKHSHQQSNILLHNKCTEGPYTCSMCFKEFSSESNLTKHKRVVKSLLSGLSAKGIFL
ncbi:zinc finger protein 35-like [Adelges cooleyi]|uniref:zinc finger protein 35-like n=1 Tax=Adelges cooleyi TaxID=133065 RepID=UPI00217F3C37|nr:zinc finger protein 35-like [Adelges cooleyi]